MCYSYGTRQVKHPQAGILRAKHLSKSVVELLLPHQYQHAGQSQAELQPQGSIVVDQRTQKEVGGRGPLQLSPEGESERCLHVAYFQ